MTTHEAVYHFIQALPFGVMLRRPLPPKRRELPPERRALPAIYSPQWQGSSFQGWAIRYVKQNLWKVRQRLGDFEDALQECAVIFVKCRKRYRFTVDNPRWFMRIFQRAVINRFIVYSKMATRERAFMQELAQQPPDIVDSLGHDHLGPLIHALRSAKGEFKMVILLLINSPAETLDSLFNSNNPTIINRRVQEHLNLDHPVDVIGELRKLLNH